MKFYLKHPSVEQLQEGADVLTRTEDMLGFIAQSWAPWAFNPHIFSQEFLKMQ